MLLCTTLSTEETYMGSCSFIEIIKQNMGGREDKITTVKMSLAYTDDLVASFT